MGRSVLTAASAAAVLVFLAACGSGSTPSTSVSGESAASMSQAVVEDGHVLPGTHLLRPHQVIGSGLSGQIAKPSENLVYHNGQVMLFPAIGLVYWGFNRKNADPDNEIPYLNSFLLHLRDSYPLNVVTQYYEISGGHKYYIPNYPAMSIAFWYDDVNALPSPHPTDKDVQQEALRAASHFNFQLPGADNLIIVAIPHGVPMNYAACAYHGRVDGFTYTNLPYQPDFGAGCGAYSVNPGPIGILDAVTETTIHEVAESMTDPLFFGWYGPGGEIGDKCQQFAANVTIHGATFPVQPLWSNETSDCRY